MKTKFGWRVIAACLVVLAWGGACKKSPLAGATKSPVIARVDEREITSADMYRSLYPQGKPVGAKPDKATARSILDQLIDRALVLKWAAGNNVKIADGDVNARWALIEADYGARGFESYLKSQGLTGAAFKQIIKEDLTVEAAGEKAVVEKVSVSYDDVVTYYNTHPAEFEAPAEYHLLQIVTEDKTKADEALAKLTYGASFEEVAREVSISPDRHTGGDVGYVRLDALPAEVGKTVTTLAPGVVSPVITTPYGFEIVKVLNVRPSGTRPLAEVRTQIEDRLRDEREGALYQTWLRGLRTNAKIAIDEKALAAL